MKNSGTMTLGTSVFLVAVGAILRYAVTVTGDGFDIGKIGVILMIAGVVGFVVSVALMAGSKNDTSVAVVSDATVVETKTVR